MSLVAEMTRGSHDQWGSLVKAKRCYGIALLRCSGRNTSIPKGRNTDKLKEDHNLARGLGENKNI